jgi:hypothetical protein
MTPLGAAWPDSSYTVDGVLKPTPGEAGLETGVPTSEPDLLRGGRCSVGVAVAVGVMDDPVTLGESAFTSNTPPPDVINGLAGAFFPQSDHRDFPGSSATTWISATGTSGSPSFERLLREASQPDAIVRSSFRLERLDAGMCRREVDGVGFGRARVLVYLWCVTKEDKTVG